MARSLTESKEVFVRKILGITSLVLLSSSFLSMGALAAPAASDAATNIITANTSQANTLPGRNNKKDEAQDPRKVAKTVAQERLKKEMSKISWTQQTHISKVIVTGNKSVSTEAINTVIEPYLKGGVTRKEAQEITDEVENLYIDDGYFLPVAHLHIEGTTLKIAVVEGKIREVLVILDDEKRDQKVLENQRFLDFIKKIELADPLKTRDLERYLILINKIHGYTAEYELEPLDVIQSNNVADLAMRVSTRKGTASISVDNYSTSSLGTNQINFSGHAFNPISNDSLILNAGTTNKPDRMRLITGGYLKRLNSYGTSANVFGSYMQSNPNKSISGSKYNISSVLKGEIEQYLVLNNDYSVKLEVATEGRSVTNYALNGIKVNDYKYTLGSVGGKIKITDPLDVENWFYPYYNWTLGKVRVGSALSSNSDSRFNFFVLDWSRNQPLPANFSLFLKASYQATNKNLPLEHAYSINTGKTARGYTTGIVSGDQGITGIVELRYSHDYESEEAQKFIKTIQPFVFYDITRFIKHNTPAKANTPAKTVHPGQTAFDKSTLPATGLGARLFLSHGFYSEGAVEFPLVRHININGVNTRNKTIYRFTISKEFNW
jgi:hemolysin activation/secretion protein